MPDKPLVKYLGFLVAFLTALFTIIAPETWTWFSPDIGWLIAGIFGSVGLAQFRLFLQTEGYKTWVLIVGQLVLSVLLATKNITAEIYCELYALLMTLAGATMVQATVKKVNGG